MYISLFHHRHGLSYTSFEFTDLTISEPSSDDAEVKVHVSLSVKNVGSVSGSEVVQLYVSYPPVGVTIPQRQLRGFVKVHDLTPGESRVVAIILDRYAFSFWDTGKGVWSIVSGTYGVFVGNSSDNLLLEGVSVVQKGLQWRGV